MRITANFTMSEFDCRDGTAVPVAQRQAIIHLVEWWLQPMRAHFGPVHVVSGYRTPSHNRAIGGAAASVHMLRTHLPGGPRDSPTHAAAADVVVRRAGASAVAAWARRHRAANPHLAPHGRGGLGVYLGAGFVHVDTASLRDWTG